MTKNPQEEQFACERCFGYPDLRARFDASHTRSNCHWCGAHSVKILPLDDFGDEFRNTVSQLYQHDVMRDVRLIDTMDSGPPTLLFGDDLLKWKCDLLELFHRFGWELSRPILPSEQEQGYEPTQHLAEFIHLCGYAGIKYPSAMGAGYNVVLFNPPDGNVEKVSYYRIRAVVVSKRTFGPYETPYEEGPYDYLFDAK